MRILLRNAEYCFLVVLAAQVGLSEGLRSDAFCVTHVAYDRKWVMPLHCYIAAAWCTADPCPLGRVRPFG